MKLKQKYDDLIKDKIGHDVIMKEFREDNDKDIIIVRLKKNLELEREKEKQLTDKLYEIQVQN